MKKTLFKNKKSNIVLIGMPGAGKSTIGVLLAKKTAMDFVDTDLLIQLAVEDTLQNIVDEKGYMALRKIEEEVICTMDCSHHIIATGGSVIYSCAAMNHLKKNSLIVFLDVEYKEIVKRVTDFGTRGIAMKEGQTFEDLFAERLPLYQSYADITIMGDNKNQDEITREICKKLAELT